jgi:hypothetical protein
VSEPDEALRRVVADVHGLDLEAARFLTGETIAELDESAATLAKLIGEHREQEPEPIAADQSLFADVFAATAHRNRELAALASRAASISRSSLASVGATSGTESMMTTQAVACEEIDVSERASRRSRPCGLRSLAGRVMGSARAFGSPPGPESPTC